MWHDTYRTYFLQAFRAEVTIKDEVWRFDLYTPFNAASGGFKGCTAHPHPASSAENKHGVREISADRTPLRKPNVYITVAR